MDRLRASKMMGYRGRDAGKRKGATQKKEGAAPFEPPHEREVPGARGAQRAGGNSAIMRPPSQGRSGSCSTSCSITNIHGMLATTVLVVSEFETCPPFECP